MQTVGTTLLTIKLRSTVRLWMTAHDRRSRHGLLYPAAVWDDGARARALSRSYRCPQHLIHRDPGAERQRSRRMRYVCLVDLVDTLKDVTAFSARLDSRSDELNVHIFNFI